MAPRQFTDFLDPWNVEDDADDGTSLPTDHPLRRLGRDLAELALLREVLCQHIADGDSDSAMLDLTKFDGLIAQINTDAAAVKATIDGDVQAAVNTAVANANEQAATAQTAAVNAAVAQQEATDQAASDAKFQQLSDAYAALQAQLKAQEATPAAPAAPTITSANPLQVPGGQPVTAQVTVSAGTIAGATSADGALTMDASGNVTGTAGPSGGSTTIPVVVTNTDGSTTDLSLPVDYQ